MDYRVAIHGVMPGCLMLAVGCASGPPADDLRESRVAVARAAEAGAARYANRELALAREKLRLGERWIAAGDYKPARWLLEQAQVDAELAAIKAAGARQAVSREAMREMGGGAQ